MYCINYVIQKGDTLYTISRRYNIGIREIMNANPLTNVYNLVVGEVLCIPAGVPSNNYTNYTTYLVEDGDTLGSILSKSEWNLADLMQLNQPEDIYLLPGSNLKVPIMGGEKNGVTL